MELPWAGSGSARWGLFDEVGHLDAEGLRAKLAGLRT
jgi:hypothetical protein